MEPINRALALVETQLDADVDVARLARVAGMSEHHFRRMFATLAGMGIAEYVRRRRMTLATAAVLAGKETLLEIALRFGYASGDSFARAFRDLHGVGPNEARRPGAVLRSQSPIRFHLTVHGGTDMRYRLVESPAFRLVGRRARLPLVYEGVNPHVQAFQRSIPVEESLALKALSDVEPRGILAGSAGFDEGRAEGSAFDYWHAVATTKPAPPGFEQLEVEAGAWVVFASSGAFPQTLQALWPAAFTAWFPTHPWALRPGPELVRMQPSADWSTADCELWLPVRAVD
jgi:AraC family transcriptional regulator